MFYRADRLLSTNFCDALSGLSFRWTQPYQQHGRRIPSLSSERTRRICSRRTSGCFTETTQQIHSLRASGVRSSHIAKALESDVRAFRKSAGNACATPPEIFLVIYIFTPYLLKIFLFNSDDEQHRRENCHAEILNHSNFGERHFEECAEANALELFMLCELDGNAQTAPCHNDNFRP